MRESVALVEEALQRCEGWNGCRTPPLGDPLQSPVELRGAPGTRTRRTRTVIGSRPTRAAFQRPSGGRPPDLTSIRKPKQAPLALSCSFGDEPLQPRTAASPVDPRVDERLVPRCCLSWAFVPYDTVSARRIRMKCGDSSHRRRVPRAGFGYPLRDLHHQAYRRAKRRSVHGLNPPRCSPRARVVLLSEPVPS
jgi:hypothetical protein